MRIVYRLFRFFDFATSQPAYALFEATHGMVLNHTRVPRGRADSEGPGEKRRVAKPDKTKPSANGWLA
ncbi:MAG TPA: hypothetical protein VNH11_04035 [Pirellulales bacterium]|nr:hypothetical protein [Pirellulales bacterium]